VTPNNCLPSDIIFPTLPSWFTAPLRVRNKRSESIHHPNGMHHREETPPPSSVDSRSLPHDHVLLESLYYGVFENRFINLRPTGGHSLSSTMTGGLTRTQAILPIHFTSNFRQVITAPVVRVRMPAIPPLPALPQPLPPNALLMSGDVEKSEAGSQPTSSSEMPTLRPSSVSFSSTDSRRTSHSASTEKSSLFDQSYSISDANTHSTSHSGEPPSPGSPHTAQATKLPFYVVDWSSAESTMGTNSRFLNPLETVDKLNESTLAMQLYWSYQSVLACQESMWEELVDRMRNRPGELKELGWESDPELNELESRPRFEVLVERYKR